jgi:hypothetical protein
LSIVTGIARSQRLLFAQVSAGSNSPAFTCPAGHVTLVKEMTTSAAPGAGCVAHLLFVQATTGNGMYLHTATVPAGNTEEHVLWVAIHPGDVVYVFGETGTSFVFVSGAVLAGPPQFPPAELAAPLHIPPLGALF